MTKPLDPAVKAARAAAGTKAGAPRKTAADPAVTKLLTQAVSLGATYDIACKYAGISIRTFYLWRKRFPPFDAAISAAEGRGAVHWLAKIEQAAKSGSWQAAAWKLERRYPEDYGRSVQDQRHSNATGDGPIEFTLHLARPVETGS